MDMNNVQGFATPSDQAVTTSDEGIPRIAIDPVSAPDLEASPPPNKLQDSFLPRSDLRPAWRDHRRLAMALLQ